MRRWKRKSKTNDPYGGKKINFVEKVVFVFISNTMNNIISVFKLIN